MEIQEFQFKNLKFIFGIFAILLLISLIVWFSVDVCNKIKEGRYIGQEIEAKNTITVSDKGEIYAKPDLALANFSVISEAKQVAEAMSENTKKMNAVIDFIKGKGVEEKDLKTVRFNLYPRYEWLEKEACLPPCPQGKRVLVGYEVEQTLEVKIRDLSKIGEIIEGATEAGANQVGDLQFTIDKQDELKKQARELAIEKAKNKAKELASQLGVKLVRITNFTESSAVPIPYSYSLEKAAGLGGEEIPQIEKGENKIEVSVSITYEIR
jgi:uncharacterized protein YggE